MNNDGMAATARRSIAGLPEQFRQHLADVVVQVQDVADADMLASVGLTHPMQLSGLYSGRPIGDKSIWDIPGGTPDRIYLFRLPILAEARDRDIPVERLIHHVTIHEIGQLVGERFEDLSAADAALSNVIADGDADRDEALVRLLHKRSLRLSMIIAGTDPDDENPLFHKLDPILE